jgi:hypothetical protein
MKNTGLNLLALSVALTLCCAISNSAQVQSSSDAAALTRGEEHHIDTYRTRFRFVYRGLPSELRLWSPGKVNDLTLFVPRAILPPLDLPVFGHGTAGRLALWTGLGDNNKWVIHDSNVFEDPQGRIGIGTITPMSPLTVAGLIESASGGFKFPDGTIQTTAAAGLSSIFHNATLSGNGTSASPLGVVVPLLLRGSSSQPIFTGQNDGPGYGIFGIGSSADGVAGVSNIADGVAGQSNGAGKSGVYGFNTSSGGFGVFGRNTATNDLGYLGANGIGVYGFSETGNGLFGQSTTGLAGNFLGNVSITGTLGIGATPSGAKLSAGGLIQSTTGGFQFPDGTIQTTAATNVSGNFIQNTATQQPNSNFNISGDGTVGGTLQAGVVTAEAFFKLGNHRMVSVDPSADVESSTSTLVGIDAGSFNLNPDAVRNSFFGREAGRNNNGINNTFLGYQSGLNNVGNPQFLAGSRNTFVGYHSGLNNGSSGAIPAGNSNTFVGDTAGNSNVDGSNNTVIGAQADVGSNNLVFATAIGSGAVVSSNNTIALGRSDGSDTVDVPGKLQIDTLASAGSTQLCLNAANRVGNCSSSLRYKTAVQPLLSGLDIISQLRPITFTWKTDGKHDLGLAAEDVAKVEPLLVTRNPDGQIEGVKYDHLNVVLINAIKQQQEQLELQQKQIQDLKKLICSDHRDASVCQ